MFNIISELKEMKTWFSHIEPTYKNNYELLNLFTKIHKQLVQSVVTTANDTLNKKIITWKRDLTQ